MVESIYFKIFYIIASYLLGSVVFGYIIAMIFKKEGFGIVDRPGTAGAARQYGLKAAIPTFLLDCAKGASVPLIGKYIGLDMITIVIASLAVLIGHNWPVFFKFKGGGGLASSIGIGTSLIPVPFLITFGVTIIAGFIYKYTLGKKSKINSIIAGSILGILLLPVLVYFFTKSLILVAFAIGMFIIIASKGLLLYFLQKNNTSNN